MREAIYYFKGAIHVGGKGILTFYKTKKFEVSRAWNGNIYLDHNGTTIAKFFLENGTPCIRLSGETPYEVKVCRELLRVINNSTEYNGGTVYVSIEQQYQAIKEGEI